MLKILVIWMLNALALFFLQTLIPGIAFNNFYSALITVLVLGIVNALIKPLIILLTLPINILTLGLFTLLINAGLFWLVSTVVKGFYLANFWTAFWAALIFSIISMLISWLDHILFGKKEL